MSLPKDLETCTFCQNPACDGTDCRPGAHVARGTAIFRTERNAPRAAAPQTSCPSVTG